MGSAAGPAVVRARTDADLDALVATLRATHAADGYPVRARAVSAAFLAPDHLAGAWVAERDGQPVGHVALVHPVDEPALVGATGRAPAGLAGIARLFVHPAARGGGLARTLLDTACGAARARDLLPVLDVVDGSPAAALYERLGWRLVTAVPAGWLADDGSRPVIRLYTGPDLRR